MPEVPGAMCCPNSSPGPPITWPGGFQMLNELLFENPDGSNICGASRQIY